MVTFKQFMSQDLPSRKADPRLSVKSLKALQRELRITLGFTPQVFRSLQHGPTIVIVSANTFKEEAKQLTDKIVDTVQAYLPDAQLDGVEHHKDGEDIQLVVKFDVR